MIYTIAIVILVLWLLGLLPPAHHLVLPAGDFWHVLLLVVVLLVLFQYARGRRL